MSTGLNRGACDADALCLARLKGRVVERELEIADLTV